MLTIFCTITMTCPSWLPEYLIEYLIEIYVEPTHIGIKSELTTTHPRTPLSFPSLLFQELHDHRLLSPITQLARLRETIFIFLDLRE